MTQPHFRGTDNPAQPSHSTMEPETRRSPCTSHGHTSIIAWQLLDFTLSCLLYSRDSNVVGFMFAKATYLFTWSATVAPLPGQLASLLRRIISSPWILLLPDLHYSSIAVTLKEHFMAPYNSYCRGGIHKGELSSRETTLIMPLSPMHFISESIRGAVARAGL